MISVLRNFFLSFNDLETFFLLTFLLKITCSFFVMDLRQMENYSFFTIFSRIRSSFTIVIITMHWIKNAKKNFKAYVLNEIKFFDNCNKNFTVTLGESLQIWLFNHKQWCKWIMIFENTKQIICHEKCLSLLIFSGSKSFVWSILGLQILNINIFYIFIWGNMLYFMVFDILITELKSFTEIL